MELSDNDEFASDTTPTDIIDIDSPITPPKSRKGSKKTHRIHRTLERASKPIGKDLAVNLAVNSAVNLDVNSDVDDTSYDSDNNRHIKPRNRYVPIRDYLYFYETTLDTIHKNTNRQVNSNNASKVFRTDLTREISSFLQPSEKHSSNSVKVPIIEQKHPTTGAPVNLPAYIPYKSDVGYNWTTSYGKIKIDKNGKINIPWNHDGFRYVKFPKSNNYILQPIYSYSKHLPKDATPMQRTVRKSKPRYNKTKTNRPTNKKA